MSSKSLLFLGLLLAMVLISSEVAAKDLAQTSNTVDASATETDQYGGGRGCRYGCGGGGGGGGYCRYGCCGRGYYGRRCRCCTFAGEKPDADFHN